MTLRRRDRALGLGHCLPRAAEREQDPGPSVARDGGVGVIGTEDPLPPRDHLGQRGLGLLVAAPRRVDLRHAEQGVEHHRMVGAVQRVGHLPGLADVLRLVLRVARHPVSGRQLAVALHERVALAALALEVGDDVLGEGDRLASLAGVGQQPGPDLLALPRHLAPRDLVLERTQSPPVLGRLELGLASAGADERGEQERGVPREGRPTRDAGLPVGGLQARARVVDVPDREVELGQRHASRGGEAGIVQGLRFPEEMRGVLACRGRPSQDRGGIDPRDGLLESLPRGVLDVGAPP